MSDLLSGFLLLAEAARNRRTVLRVTEKIFLVDVPRSTSKPKGPFWTKGPIVVSADVIDEINVGFVMIFSGTERSIANYYVMKPGTPNTDKEKYKQFAEAEIDHLVGLKVLKVLD